MILIIIYLSLFIYQYYYDRYLLFEYIFTLLFITPAYPSHNTKLSKLE